MTKLTPVIDENLVAYCGLYCGSCAKYMKGNCPGCKENTKATWCKIRTCNIENGFKNCSHCNMEGISENNTIGKVFALIFKTDRPASLKFIEQHGELIYSQKMSEFKQMAIKKKQTINL